MGAGDGNTPIKSKLPFPTNILEDIIRKTPLFAILALLVVLVAPAHAQVPDGRQVVQNALKGLNLGTHDGQAQGVDLGVCALAATDSRWGHLKKRPDQTQIHGHAEDAALWLADQPGQSVAVDFIIDAGTPNANANGWSVDTPRYSKSDWLPPHNCGNAPSPTPTPTPNPAVDLQPVLSRLDALAAEVSALQLQVASVGETLRSVATRQEVLISRPTPTYSGKVLGFPITLRPNTP